MLEIKTSIEKVDADTKEVLDWKLKQLQDKNLPIESGIADYVYFGLENIALKIEQYKNYKKDIDNEIKALTSHSEKIKEDVAEWIESQGLDRIEGVKCSSITINKAKPSEETKEIKTNIVYLFEGKELEDKLIEFGLAYIEKKEVIKIIPETKAKIRVNKKRA